jgi:hypothetical protein
MDITSTLHAVAVVALPLLIIAFGICDAIDKAKAYNYRHQQAQFLECVMHDTRTLVHDHSANCGMVPTGLIHIYTNLLSLVHGIRLREILLYCEKNNIDPNSLKHSDCRNKLNATHAAISEVMSSLHTATKEGAYEKKIPKRMRDNLLEIVNLHQQGDLRLLDFFRLYTMMVTTNEKEYIFGGIQQKLTPATND